MTQESLPASLFRGGTSKGVYFRERDLPAERRDRERLLLKTFGSPDPMQLDGIGGSHSTTSKAMIVSASDADGVDVDYRFGQVGVDTPVVDWGGNCGNLSFAIGPFALERNVASADVDDGRTDLVLRNENTGTVVEQSLPVRDGAPRYDGDFKVHGVPGTGGRITSRFRSPGGSVTGAVFPTGNRVDTLAVAGVGDVEASLVDVSSPCVFVRASALGLDGTELPAAIDADADLLDRLERVRGAACERYGFVDDPAAASAESPGIPKLALVGERRAYETVSGDRLGPGEYDLLARIMSMQKAHHAYAVTGAMCTAVAAALPGTIPNEYLDATRPDEVVIGHPKGPMRVGVGLDGEDVAYTAVDRTARQIIAGDLYYLPD
jgi:2-methylaconitate cis-trans-isomerase PrpF